MPNTIISHNLFDACHIQKNLAGCLYMTHQALDVGLLSTNVHDGKADDTEFLPRREQFLDSIR